MRASLRVQVRVHLLLHVRSIVVLTTWEKQSYALIQIFPFVLVDILHNHERCQKLLRKHLLTVLGPRLVLASAVGASLLVHLKTAPPPESCYSLQITCLGAQ